MGQQEPHIYVRLFFIIRILIRLFLVLIFFVFSFVSCNPKNLNEYKPSNIYLSYVGRFDFSDKENPKTWASGAYVQVLFSGTSFSFDVKDNASYGEHNIIEYQVDDLPVQRMKLKWYNNRITIPLKLKRTKHKIVICKSTESGVGSISFTKFLCEKLLNANSKKCTIEFIGDSITCGNGVLGQKSDKSDSWYSFHSAYYAFGPCLARKWNANWVLSSVSGFGIGRSCCDNSHTIKDIYPFVDLSKRSIAYKFKDYNPSLVFICLGQNDGQMREHIFQSKYISFLKELLRYYPNTTFICANSPMAKDSLKLYLRKNIRDVVSKFSKYKKSIYYFEYEKRYNNGVKNHPNRIEHQQMANEINIFIEQNKLISITH